MVLLDGLYPNGPIMELCGKSKWDFMIVLQDKTLKSVWEEYEGPKKLETKNYCNTTWGNRIQRFEWVNDIEYYYGPKERKKQIVHVVVCEENWQEIAKDSAEIVTMQSRHAWISSKPLDKWNVHNRCNLGSRHRWGIESSFFQLVTEFLDSGFHRSDDFLRNHECWIEKMMGYWKDRAYTKAHQGVDRGTSPAQSYKVGV